MKQELKELAKNHVFYQFVHMIKNKPGIKDFFPDFDIDNGLKGWEPVRKFYESVKDGKMKSTELLLKQGYYHGFRVKKGNLCDFINRKNIEVWDANCRCIQQINRVLFPSMESILKNSLLSDNTRIVHVDYSKRIITDLSYERD